MTDQRETEWVLARARVIRAGIRLVLSEIDEIGISLKNGWITPERAANDLAALEELPVYFAAMFLSDQSGAAGIKGADA
jgi:hypothetical protein